MTLPVNIKAIIKHYSYIRLIPYSTHMRRHNLTYPEMLSHANTPDACTNLLTIDNQKKYLIFYNDIDKNINLSNRYRWNIAHELGHILMCHLELNDKTRIFRSQLSDFEYDSLEEEADYFASLLLAPYSAIYLFDVSVDSIMKMCAISRPASKRRFYDFQRWKLSSIHKKEFYDKFIFQHYYSFIFKKRCTTCQAVVVQHYGKYCPICGTKSLIRGDGLMVYPKHETDENGRLKKCIRCQNEELHGAFCHICGSIVDNHCHYAHSDDNYDEHHTHCTHTEPLPSNSRFCHICGGISTFSTHEVLEHWNKETFPPYEIPDGIDEELPFN